MNHLIKHKSFCNLFELVFLVAFSSPSMTSTCDCIWCGLVASDHQNQSMGIITKQEAPVESHHETGCDHSTLNRAESPAAKATVVPVSSYQPDPQLRYAVAPESLCTILFVLNDTDLALHPSTVSFPIYLRTLSICR